MPILIQHKAAIPGNTTIIGINTQNAANNIPFLVLRSAPNAR
jgi:hypothetical protein